MKTWADPSTPNDRKGRVWIIQKADSERKELRSPRDCFWEPDRYTIQTDAGKMCIRDSGESAYDIAATLERYEFLHAEE